MDSKKYTLRLLQKAIRSVNISNTSWYFHLISWTTDRMRQYYIYLREGDGWSSPVSASKSIKIKVVEPNLIFHAPGDFPPVNTQSSDWINGQKIRILDGT